MVSLPGRKIMCNRFSDHDDSLFSQIIHQVIGMDFPLISLGIVWTRLPLWIHYSSREMTSAWKMANIVLNINWMLSTQLVQMSLGSLAVIHFHSWPLTFVPFASYQTKFKVNWRGNTSSYLLTSNRLHEKPAKTVQSSDCRSVHSPLPKACWAQCGRRLWQCPVLSGSTDYCVALFNRRPLG